MVSAIKIYNEAGSAKYIEGLIKDGCWNNNANYLGSKFQISTRK